MTIEELHQTVVDGFRRVDERFVANDKRLDAVDKRSARTDERLDRIEAKFAELRSDLEARIKEEGATTRRHFEVVVEKVEAAVRIVARGPLPPGGYRGQPRRPAAGHREAHVARAL